MKQFLLMAMVIVGYAAFSQDDGALRKKQFNLDNGVALSGYDPVAYFAQSKAVKGNKDFALTNNGITYYFSSAANKEEFKKAPAKYEPQYGGWCAYAMGKDGSKVEIDPETFKIINGKLFVFYNKFFNNTLKSWNKDETKLHQQADANRQKIYH